MNNPNLKFDLFLGILAVLISGIVVAVVIAAFFISI